ncbi:MAG: PqqD family protein [Renibacterium sp.]|nr:PqqD family protein [Renibacterium sp.]
MKNTSLVSRRLETSTASIDDGSALVLDLSSDNCVPLRLEGSALAIWAELSEPVEFGELCRRMAQRFGAVETSISPDIEKFVTELVSAHLVQVDGKPA